MHEKGQPENSQERDSQPNKQFLPADISQGFPRISDEILDGKGLSVLHDFFWAKAAYQQAFDYRENGQLPVQKLATALHSRFAREVGKPEIVANPELRDAVLDILREYGVELCPEMVSVNDIASSLVNTFKNNHPSQFEQEKLSMLLVLEELEDRGIIRIDSFSRTDLSDWTM